MLRKHNTVFLIYITVAGYLFSGTPFHLIPAASAEVFTQQISGAVGDLVVPAGGTTSVTAQYSVSDGNASLSGFGVRIHYDSSILTWTGFPLVLSDSLIGRDSSPVDDIDDEDGDPNTDVYLTLAWADIGSNWPGEEPVALFTTAFEVSSSFATAEVSFIRFSSVDTAAGYDFESTPVKVVSGLTLDVARTLQF